MQSTESTPLIVPDKDDALSTHPRIQPLLQYECFQGWMKDHRFRAFLKNMLNFKTRTFPRDILEKKGWRNFWTLIIDAGTILFMDPRNMHDPTNHQDAFFDWLTDLTMVVNYMDSIQKLETIRFWGDDARQQTYQEGEKKHIANLKQGPPADTVKYLEDVTQLDELLRSDENEDSVIYCAQQKIFLYIKIKAKTVYILNNPSSGKISDELLKVSDFNVVDLSENVETHSHSNTASEERATLNISNLIELLEKEKEKHKKLIQQIETAYYKNHHDPLLYSTLTDKDKELSLRLEEAKEDVEKVDQLLFVYDALLSRGKEIIPKILKLYYSDYVSYGDTVNTRHYLSPSTIFNKKPSEYSKEYIKQSLQPSSVSESRPIDALNTSPRLPKLLHSFKERTDDLSIFMQLQEKVSTDRKWYATMFGFAFALVIIFYIGITAMPILLVAIVLAIMVLLQNVWVA